MNRFKSVLLTLHLQTAMVLLFLALYHLGVPAFRPFNVPLKDLLAYSVVLFVLYFLSAVLVGQLMPKIHAWPNKALILWILLFGLYTFSFAASQTQAQAWLVFAIGHYPLGWFYQTLLPRQFDLIFQFALAIGTLSPALGLRLGMALSARLNRPKRKTSR